MNKTRNKNIECKFLGAAGTVTGSCYLITHPGGKFLVDCGLFQGSKSVRALNYPAFSFQPSEIDFVVLTHAHVDHSGLVPKLVKSGFQNKVYATEGTRDLLTYMLPDSGYIHETEVRRLNRRNLRRGIATVEPIYTKSDGERAIEFIHTQPYAKQFEAAPGVQVRFWNAGHILGSASVEVIVETDDGPVKLVFSGDIGPDEKAFHPIPESPTDIDYLFVESTYGDRERTDITLEERREVLKREILDGLNAGGNVLIPAFAVERTQELLYDIGLLLDDKDLPPVSVYLDSPLAIRATEVFESHAANLNDVSARGGLFRNPRFNFVNRAEDSMALDRITSGAIIIAASGMCDAGRIRYHLKSNLWRPQATVLFVGYQAPGSLGATLLNGNNSVRIHGREISVKARIRRIDNYSAHADQKELINWVTARLPIKRGIFITHGEDMARATMRDHLIAHGCKPKHLFIPKLDETFVLSLKGKVKHSLINPRIEQEDTMCRDWHNDYASFLVNLSETLRTRETDVERHKALSKLRNILDKIEAGP
ncbi:MAG: MBL fold metallo-hydrolase [Magnetovibrio sp.]|nr:MBL fold metallo-hydrolase [Magnetovibrio sp.]